MGIMKDTRSKQEEEDRKRYKEMRKEVNEEYNWRGFVALHMSCFSLDNKTVFIPFADYEANDHSQTYSELIERVGTGYEISKFDNRTGKNVGKEHCKNIMDYLGY